MSRYPMTDPITIPPFPQNKCNKLKFNLLHLFFCDYWNAIGTVILKNYHAVKSIIS
jgi:hypothetical protein